MSTHKFHTPYCECRPASAVETNNEYRIIYENDKQTGQLKQVAKIKYKDEAQEFAEVADIRNNAIYDPKSGRLIDLSGRKVNKQVGNQNDMPQDLTDFSEQRERFANEAAAEIDAFVKNKQQQLKNKQTTGEDKLNEKQHSNN